MKSMKLMLAAAFVAVAGSAVAEDYNRVELSYINQHYGANKEYGKDASYGANGIGVGYTHGFGLSETLPMYLDLGGNINFNFSKQTEKEHGYEYANKFQNINLTVPVNFVWKFNIGEDMSIRPYAGINFKLNFVDRDKSGYKEEGKWKWNDDWTNLHSDNDKTGVDKDEMWNTFQMGWQVGASFQYSTYSLGLQYGTDFIPAYSHNFEGYKPKISTGTFKVTLGYYF